jgi:Flp pilus assembly protein TadG
MVRRRRAGRPGDAPRRGQSLVELAVMLPLLALITVGTIDLGRAFFAYQRLTNAVREGALFGSRYPGYVTATSITATGVVASTDPYNVVYQIQKEGADVNGTPDSNLSISIVSNSNSDVLCYEGRSATTLLTTGTYAGDCSKAKTGDTIQVRASYAFRPLTTQIIGNVGSPLQMRATVRMVIQ